MSLQFTKQHLGLHACAYLQTFSGRTAYFIALCYTGLMLAFFMLKTMANAIPVGPSSRDVVIAALALLQFAGTWWLGDSKDLY